MAILPIHRSRQDSPGASVLILVALGVAALAVRHVLSPLEGV